MPGVIPHLTIPGRRAKDAVDFYAAAFGATEQNRHLADDGERLMHAHLSLNGGDLMLNDEFPEYGAQVGVPEGTTLHVQVDDADAAWERAVAAGDRQDAARQPVLGRPLRPASRPVRVHVVDRWAGEGRRLGGNVTGYFARPVVDLLEQ